MELNGVLHQGQGQGGSVGAGGKAGGVGADASRGGGGAPPTPLPMTGQMAPPTQPTPPLVNPVSHTPSPHNKPYRGKAAQIYHFHVKRYNLRF